MSEQAIQNQTADQQPAPVNKDWTDTAIICLMLVLVLCLGVVSYFYFYRQGGGAGRALNKKVAAMEQQMSADQGRLAMLQHAVEQLQLATQQTQALTAKQEQIIGDWQAVQKGDMNKWYMSEAQYLVKLANDHAQYSHNIDMAITLLQRADQVLLPMQETSAIEIRQSIGSNISTLQALPQINVSDLYLKLSVLDSQINQLPLLSVPIKPEAQTSEATAAEPDKTWWQAGLEKTWQALQKIVIVRQAPTGAMPLVLPEDKTFAYQSLHAEMQNAMWAVLHHQPDIFQVSIDRQIAWIQQYFMQDAPQTQAMLSQLTALRNLNIKPQTADLSGTLQLFSRYFSSAGVV